MLLDRLGPPGRGRGCRPHDAEVAGGAVADLGLLISGPRIILKYDPYARARARLARPWSARCYGVARHREGSRQKQQNKAIADQSPLLKLNLRRVRFQRTSTRQQLDCAKTL